MRRYLMNAAVIPHGCPGTFTYHLATVEDLVTFLQAGEVINTIVYPAKVGQHLLYLFGELCRLANDLPAHLMATATRVWEHEAFFWKRLNGRFLLFIQTLRNESAEFPTSVRKVLAMFVPRHLDVGQAGHGPALPGAPGGRPRLDAAAGG